MTRANKAIAQSVHARDLIGHVRDVYGCELECLWARMPDDGVWRRGDNQKWFAGLFHVARDKVIPNANNERIAILNLRCIPDVLEFIVDKRNIFPGWHMNKRHWITIPLDGRMDLDNIYKLLDASYQIAAKR